MKNGENLINFSVFIFAILDCEETFYYKYFRKTRETGD